MTTKPISVSDVLPGLIKPVIVYRTCTECGCQFPDKLPAIFANGNLTGVCYVCEHLKKRG
jgi:hypothetical protein